MMLVVAGVVIAAGVVVLVVVLLGLRPHVRRFDRAGAALRATLVAGMTALVALRRR